MLLIIDESDYNVTCIHRIRLINQLFFVEFIKELLFFDRFHRLLVYTGWEKSIEAKVKLQVVEPV